jgi:hypothetical protein
MAGIDEGSSPQAKLLASYARPFLDTPACLGPMSRLEERSGLYRFIGQSVNGQLSP